MLTSSKTTQRSETFNSDERIITDANGVSINSGGGEVFFVPDEAFSLAKFALSENGEFAQSALKQVAAANDDALSTATKANKDALYTSTQANRDALRAVTTSQRTEASQLGEQAIKIVLPIAAIYFISKGYFK